MLEDGARRPPSYYSFFFCNNYAKCKDKSGYLKSRTGVSVPRPPCGNIFHLLLDGCCWMSVGGRGTEATVLL